MKNKILNVVAKLALQLSTLAGHNKIIKLGRAISTTTITKILVLLLLAYSVFDNFIVYADVPLRINYQERLKENNMPVTGNRDFQFSITDANDTPPSWKWTSPRVTIPISNGLFNYVITPPSLDWRNITPYIQVSVGPADGVSPLTPLLPREQIKSSIYALYVTSVGYAYTSAGAGGNGWTDDGTVVRLETISDNTGIGTANPDRKLDVNSGMVARSSIVVTGTGLSIGAVPAVRVMDTLLVINTDGKAGVGTANPSHKFEVNGGTINVTGTGKLLQGGNPLVPAGMIVMTGRSAAPAGWLLCDGSLISKNDYPALYGSIGITYGGDGSPNFRVPDMRGRAAMGVDGTAARISANDALGNKEGSESQSHTLTTAEMPQHSHTNSSGGGSITATGNHNHTEVGGNIAGPISVSGATSYGYTNGGGNTTSAGGHTHSFSISVTVNASGSGTAFSMNVIQPYTVVNFMIKY